MFIIVLVCIRSNLNGEKLDYTHFKFESLITYFIADCEPVEKQSEMYSPFSDGLLFIVLLAASPRRVAGLRPDCQRFYILAASPCC